MQAAKALIVASSKVGLQSNGDGTRLGVKLHTKIGLPHETLPT